MGMVATAVSSLSVEPPSILVCVNHGASIHGDLLREEDLCVNILHTDQLELARLFSDDGRREHRFSIGQWADTAAVPCLADAQAVLSCRRVGHVDFATHSIVIGEVHRVRVREEVDPLLYLDGRFARSRREL